MIYANHDLKLCESALLTIRSKIDTGQNGEFKSTDVEFQFPPRILSDNRKGVWEEPNVPGTEPASSFSNSGPREFALTWTYIVDGKPWTTSKIARNIKLVRGYYASARSRKKDDTLDTLIVYFKYGLYGDPDPTSPFHSMTCRIKSIDVKHSDTVIIPPNEYTRAFPLRTDITADMRIWLNEDDKEDADQNKPDLEGSTPITWY